MAFFADHMNCHAVFRVCGFIICAGNLVHFLTANGTWMTKQHRNTGEILLVLVALYPIALKFIDVLLRSPRFLPVVAFQSLPKLDLNADAAGLPPKSSGLRTLLIA